MDLPVGSVETRSAPSSAAAGAMCLLLFYQPLQLA